MPLPPTIPDPDLPLLQRFAAGDRAALGELAQRFEAPLMGLATGLLGPRQQLAADAVQDAWLRVIRSASTFQARSTVKTWLYRIVINRCHDLRSTRKTPAGPVLRLAEDADEPRPRTEQPTAEHDRLDPLRAALDRLKPDQRLLLLLCYHHDMTLTQAAQVLDIPVGTVKSRLHTALESLRKTLATSLGPSFSAARAHEAAP